MAGDPFLRVTAVRPTVSMCLLQAYFLLVFSRSRPKPVARSHGCTDSPIVTNAQHVSRCLRHDVVAIAVHCYTWSLWNNCSVQNTVRYVGNTIFVTIPLSYSVNKLSLALWSGMTTMNTITLWNTPVVCIAILMRCIAEEISRYIDTSSCRCRVALMSLVVFLRWRLPSSTYDTATLPRPIRWHSNYTNRSSDCAENDQQSARVCFLIDASVWW